MSFDGTQMPTFEKTDDGYLSKVFEFFHINDTDASTIAEWIRSHVSELAEFDQTTHHEELIDLLVRRIQPGQTLILLNNRARIVRGHDGSYFASSFLHNATRGEDAGTLVFLDMKRIKDEETRQQIIDYIKQYTLMFITAGGFKIVDNEEQLSAELPVNTPLEQVAKFIDNNEVITSGQICRWIKANISRIEEESTVDLRRLLTALLERMPYESRLVLIPGVDGELRSYVRRDDLGNFHLAGALRVNDIYGLIDAIISQLQSSVENDGLYIA